MIGVLLEVTRALVGDGQSVVENDVIDHAIGAPVQVAGICIKQPHPT